MATPMMTPGMATPSGMGGVPGQRLPPEVNRILYVRNLPFTISAEDMYKIFGDYGAIRQIRQCALSAPASILPHSQVDSVVHSGTSVAVNSF